MQMQREKNAEKKSFPCNSRLSFLLFSFLFIFWGKLDGNWVNKIANVVDVVVVMLVPSLSLTASLLLASSF